MPFILKKLSVSFPHSVLPCSTSFRFAYNHGLVAIGFLFDFCWRSLRLRLQNSVHLYSFFPIPYSPFPASTSDSAIQSDYYISDCCGDRSIALYNLLTKKSAPTKYIY